MLKKELRKRGQGVSVLERDSRMSREGSVDSSDSLDSRMKKKRKEGKARKTKKERATNAGMGDIVEEEEEGKGEGEGKGMSGGSLKALLEGALAEVEDDLEKGVDFENDPNYNPQMHREENRKTRQSQRSKESEDSRDGGDGSHDTPP